MSETHTGGGADHQQDHDLPGACGAFQHVRDRPIHGHGAYESWRDGSAFSIKNNELFISHPYIQSAPEPSIVKLDRETPRKEGNEA